MKDYNCDLIGKVISVEENPDGAEIYLSVIRPNKKEDLLPVLVSNECLGNTIVTLDSTIQVLGIIKTLRMKDSYKSKLRVEAVSIQVLPDDTTHKNKVFGRFEVKNSRAARITSTNHKVKDLILKRFISEKLGTSEFRAIIWDDHAELYDGIQNGAELYIIGRLQCKKYTKKTEDGKSKVKTYEVTVGKVENDTDTYAEVEVNG